jgi:hypothetical protein
MLPILHWFNNNCLITGVSASLNHRRSRAYALSGAERNSALSGAERNSALSGAERNSALSGAEGQLIQPPVPGY